MRLRALRKMVEELVASGGGGGGSAPTFWKAILTQWGAVAANGSRETAPTYVDGDMDDVGSLPNRLSLGADGWYLAFVSVGIAKQSDGNPAAGDLVFDFADISSSVHFSEERQSTWSVVTLGPVKVNNDEGYNTLQVSVANGADAANAGVEVTLVKIG